MEVKLTYNSLVNKILSKLGTRKGLVIEIAEGNKTAAESIMQKISDTIRVRATFEETVSEYKSPVRCLGVTIAKASSRDSGAYVPSEVVYIEGEADSGGSMKNWRTNVFSGAVVEFDVPQFIYDKFHDAYEDIRIEKAPAMDSNDLIDNLSLEDE